MSITRRQALTATATTPLALLAPLPAMAMPRIPLQSVRTIRLSDFACNLRNVARDWPDFEPMVSEPLERVIKESKTRIADNENQAILMHFTETGELVDDGDPVLAQYFSRRF